MGNTLCNPESNDTIDILPQQRKQSATANLRNKESISSLGRTSVSTRAYFSLFNKLGKGNTEERKQMLEAKWTQYRYTSNLFDEAGHRSKESNTSHDNATEPKVEHSRTAE